VNIIRFFRAIDTRDWQTVRDGLADRVTLDYVSVFGGEVETIAAEEVVERWRALLPGFDATQHFLSELATGGDGVLECNVRGHHVIGDRVWMVAGWYRLTLAGDRLSGIALDASYETGSRDLVDEAQKRAARR
jgi:hypothetical protein